MPTRDIYEDGFDEDDGKTIHLRSCPECQARVHTEGGETVCAGCGLVVDAYRIDHGPEWMAYEDRPDVNRVGAPLTEARHDRGLSTEIGQYRDGRGDPLSGTTQVRFSRLRTQHRRARFRTKAEGNLATALGEIARLVAALDLPWTLRERASSLYREAMTRDLIRGRSIECMAAGAVYAACRCAGQGLTVDALADVSSCSVHQVKLGYSVLNRELDLAARVPQASDAVARICSSLDLPVEVRARAVELLQRAEEAGLTNGRSPSGVAGTVVYLVVQETGISVTQTAIAAAAGTTTTTVRSRAGEFGERLGLTSGA